MKDDEKVKKIKIGDEEFTMVSGWCDCDECQANREESEATFKEMMENFEEAIKVVDNGFKAPKQLIMEAMKLLGAKSLDIETGEPLEDPADIDN